MKQCNWYLGGYCRDTRGTPECKRDEQVSCPVCGTVKIYRYPSGLNSQILKQIEAGIDQRNQQNDKGEGAPALLPQGDDK
jgi:uncharacterized Zn finger protein (UPF0148 family)